MEEGVRHTLITKLTFTIWEQTEIFDNHSDTCLYKLTTINIGCVVELKPCQSNSIDPEFVEKKHFTDIQVSNS